MTRTAVWATSVMVALLAGACVEQEPYRPTADDKKIIQENILSKAPDMKFKVNADLEGKVIYLGADVEADKVEPGKPFKVVHYWQVKQPPTGWKLFVHINGPNKQGFINADHVPIDGRYPVTRWKAGEIVRDEHTVTLPANWKEPEATIYVGLWKGKLRMKVKQEELVDDEGRIKAATLKTTVAATPAPPVPRIVATRADGEVKIDGVLDDAVWKRAASTGLFKETLKGGKGTVDTEAMVAWDDKNLYVAFKNTDKDVWGALDKRDDKLWTQEAVEVFLDVNGDGKDYIELQASPQGTIFDSYLPGYRKNQNDWNSSMKVGVKVEGTLNKREDEDKGWNVELAIPWSDARGRGAEVKLPPEEGRVMRMNLFRLDMPKGRAQQAVAWSPPLVGDFHKLDRFGHLVLGNDKGEAPAAAAEPAKEEAPKKDEEAKDEEAKEPAAAVVAPGEQPSLMVQVPLQRAESIRDRMPRLIRPPARTPPPEPQPGK